MPRYETRLKRDLAAWTEDEARIAAIQRIDDSWAASLTDLLASD